MDSRVRDRACLCIGARLCHSTLNRGLAPTNTLSSEDAFRSEPRADARLQVASTTTQHNSLASGLLVAFHDALLRAVDVGRVCIEVQAGMIGIALDLVLAAGNRRVGVLQTVVGSAVQGADSVGRGQASTPDSVSGARATDAVLEETWSSIAWDLYNGVSMPSINRRPRRKITHPRDVDTLVVGCALGDALVKRIGVDQRDVVEVPIETALNDKSRTGSGIRDGRSVGSWAVQRRRESAGASAWDAGSS